MLRADAEKDEEYQRMQSNSEERRRSKEHRVVCTALSLHERVKDNSANNI